MKLPINNTQHIQQLLETNYVQKFIHFHSDEAYYNMQNILENVEFMEPGSPGLIELICKLLEEEKFERPEDISNAVISLLKFDPIIKDVFSKISAADELSESLQEIIVNLSNVPLLLKLMVALQSKQILEPEKEKQSKSTIPMNKTACRLVSREEKEKKEYNG